MFIVPLAVQNAKAAEATGIVYHDVNTSGTYDAGDKPLEGVKVSNGEDVVRTDRSGRYRLPIGEDSILFVIKPRNWRTPFNAQNLPRFHYIHKPQGSPASKYPGVAPTGPLPKSVDFPLYPQQEPGKFKTILVADSQTRTHAELGYYAHDIVESLVGTDAAFVIGLGDIVHDDLSLLEPINEINATVGIPWYNVIGNHELNHDSKNDRFSDETFERFYGPPYYSFDYGPVHFVALDDIEWYSPGPNGRPAGMRASLGEKQLHFLENDLLSTPDDQLVVLTMHAPFEGFTEKERQQLFRMIEKKPHCISIAAHYHRQIHHFYDTKDGWQGSKPHHHMLTVAASGSWWSGRLDERGIPHTMMSDGAPNGYAIMTFEGTDYQLDFRAAGRPADYQMEIMAPDAVPIDRLAETDVYVNVFDGSERSRVRVRWDDRSEWINLTWTEEISPNYRAAVAFEETIHKEQAFKKLPAFKLSSHLWKGKLPAGVGEGTHLLHVLTEDLRGRQFEGRRIIRVSPRVLKPDPS